MSFLSQQSKKKPTALVVVVEGVVSRPGPAQWSEPVRGLGTCESLEVGAVQLLPVGWVPQSAAAALQEPARPARGGRPSQARGV